MSKSKSKGKHLSKPNREAIEDGVRAGRSARGIAASIGVAPATVTREVKTNRTVAEPKRGAAPTWPRDASATPTAR